MDKNYFLALALSLFVLMGYSFFLQKTQPKTAAPAIRPQTAQITPPSLLAEAQQPFLKSSETDTASPAISTAEVKKIDINTQLFSAKLTSRGGGLQQLVFNGERKKSGVRQLVFFEAASEEPGALTVRMKNEDIDLSLARFETRPTPKGVDYIYEKSGEYRLSKHFYFGSEDPIVGFDITVENLSPNEKAFPLQIDYALQLAPNMSGPEAHAVEAVVMTQKIEEKQMDKLKKKPAAVYGDIKWTGLVEKYFAFLVKPDWKIIQAEARYESSRLWMSQTMEPFLLPPGGAVKKEVFIYAGPQRYEVLKKFGAGFEDLMARGFFGPLKIMLLKVLKFFDRHIHNFGWTIILLTLIIKVLFAPLTHMSFESAGKMQALQPKVKAIQEQYKNDPSKMNHAMMDLYKRNKVNPLGGCLPMLLQIPIFIAFYQVLDSAIELKGAPFIGWIRDLAAPDQFWRLPFALPVLGEYINILPLLMLGSMVWQQKLTPQMGTTPDQAKMMAWMMPVMFGFLFYKMPSGLVLYWFVNNLLTVFHQTIVKRMIVIPHHDH